MTKQYIVTNFAYGTGPYLRTTDLAVCFNNELERRGHERLDIIVPWVYGEKQKRIMFEEFYEHELAHPGEILFDPVLGQILKENFYGEHQSYAASLEAWISKYKNSSHTAKKHLSSSIFVSTITGQEKKIDARNIVVELNRAPRLTYDVAPSYFTSFGYISKILREIETVPEHIISVDRDLVKRGVEVADVVETGHRIHALAYPGTFSELPYEPLFSSEILTPPIAPLPKHSQEDLSKGLFVTTTGIPGLGSLYKDATRLGLKLYSNDIKAVPSSVFATPHIIPNTNTILQFARSGWSSVWISMISGTPLVMPAFDPTDDPEIYFNNRTVEALKLGLIYKQEPLEEILEKLPEITAACTDMSTKIKRKWGTLNGNQFCAERFVEDFLRL